MLWVVYESARVCVDLHCFVMKIGMGWSGLFVDCLEGLHRLFWIVDVHCFVWMCMVSLSIVCGFAWICKDGLGFVMAGLRICLDLQGFV